ncbi:MAG: hypothetical protein ACFE0I_08070 [Elainellaceae cyanobacterium]
MKHTDWNFALPDSTLHRSKTDHLETYVRDALTVGELTPAVETQIKQMIHMGNLSRRDFALLSILRDAIQDGCIQRLAPHYQELGSPNMS